MKTLLDSLIQVSIFGDFGLTKKSLGEILNRKNTKMTSFLNILKKNNLCLEIRSGRHCFYKANLDELYKLKNITF